ncbi:hypothetical protein Tco_1241743 [Tanacetum coccineum]
MQKLWDKNLGKDHVFVLDKITWDFSVGNLVQLWVQFIPGNGTGVAAAAMKHMASNFAKIEKFERVDFRIWQKKMHIFFSMSVVYVLTTLIPQDGENATMEHIRRRNK